ncbi:MAG: EAL domain-containing protein [Gammaproteobacteria bacterium]|nr:EAL domain-containing protein [Gammaproteobacteria bacterium]
MDLEHPHIPVILIADDDPAIRLVLRHAMEQEGYHVIEVANGLEAIQATVRQHPDLILMDAVMPQMDGFRATSELKGMEDHYNIPVLIITSLDDDLSVEQAFNVGACDYITKPVNWSVLKQRVKRLLFAANAERKIEHLAYHDTLTGLPNRMLFMDRMDQAISRAMRNQENFALLFIDIDNFKVINDSMGHEAGDKLLISITQRLRETLRMSDTIARLGGDEFTVVLENLSEPEAVILVVKNLLEKISEPIEISGREVHIGASIGISMYPDDGISFGNLLKNADTAMYRAKDLGRNTFQFYTAEMSEIAMRRLELENSLRNAVESQDFVIFYQPKYDFKRGKCCGMEALVRWDHPEKGIVSPDEFIPLAEETGLIVPLGEWVIKTACAQYSLWKQAGYVLNNISINVSARQFHEQDITGLFQQVLQETGLNPAEIEIELTESTLISNQRKARGIINELHDMGLLIALDDFGTGYASMSYLKDFPIDTVKIDRSFVRDIPDDKEDTAIVKAITGLAEALGLSLIAEGVETEQQIMFLKDIGCLHGQGYYWSKPVSALEFERTILR